MLDKIINIQIKVSITIIIIHTLTEIINQLISTQIKMSNNYLYLKIQKLTNT
jgi:hypothetical protein